MNEFMTPSSEREWTEEEKQEFYNAWIPIVDASKIAGKEMIGIRRLDGKASDPFITFWSPTLNKFYCDPTHFIPMPKFQEVSP